MADPTVAYPTPQNPHLTTTDLDALPTPPLDPTIFSQDLILPDNLLFFDDIGDFDFNFDDLDLPSDSEDFLNSTLPASNPVQILFNSESKFSNQGVSDPESSRVSGDRRSSGARFLTPESPESGFLNVQSSDTALFNQDCSQESGNNNLNVIRGLNCPSPESGTHDLEFSGLALYQRSGNFGSAGSETLINQLPDSGNNWINGVLDQRIKLNNMGKNISLKRKKENEGVNSETRINKHPRSNAVGSANQSHNFNAANDDEDKKKERLMRNRESAQLSRQRKKHYVEELEDKVRKMHSTIQDLSTKISYIVAENASLRQQLNGGAVPPPGMYPQQPMAPMVYPWMPYPPYVVKPQGSQVPLVPIPRLKRQPSVSAPKAKKVESKKTMGRTKKVASVSFLDLLVFILLFGGLLPMVNVKYGEKWVAFPGGSDYIGNRFYNQQHGRVLTVNSHLNGTNPNVGIGVSNENFSAEKHFSNTVHSERGHVGRAESNIEQKEGGLCTIPSSNEFVRSSNASEPLVASLYVPRNDKLVKIDGNLIIHSVLASEKAMACREDQGSKSAMETGLAVALNLAPAIPIPGVGRSNGRHPHLYRSLTERQRALASVSAADKGNPKSTATDGKLQQWFREGLAGPMFSSGMCSEVFQFDVSPASAPGGIITATSVRNISAEYGHNSTHNKGRNRRILPGLPIALPGPVHNITNKHMGSNSQKENSHRNNTLSSMVVSVLVDPREVGDTEGDGTTETKSLSRIFVVVLLDSVKYVTYSCILPFKGSNSHLLTT